MKYSSPFKYYNKNGVEGNARIEEINASNKQQKRGKCFMWFCRKVHLFSRNGRMRNWQKRQQTHCERYEKQYSNGAPNFQACPICIFPLRINLERPLTIPSNYSMNPNEQEI